MSQPNKMTVRQRLSFLAKDTAIYGIGGALNKILALITFPLLARHFSVEDFGRIELLNTSVVLLVTLFVFGQDSAVARFFYEDTDTEYRRQLASQSLAFQFLILSCTLPALWFSTGMLTSLLSAGSDGESIIRLMIMQVPFFLLINFGQGILKWTFKRSHFLYVSVGSAAFTLTGLVVCIMVFEMGIVEVFVVYLITRALFGLLALWFVRQWLTFPAGCNRLKELLPFAIPYGVICAIGALIPVLERGLAGSLLGDHDLGLFAAGAKVAMLIALPITAFEIAWGPFSLSIFKEANAHATYRLVLKIVTASMFSAVLLLTAVAEIFIVTLGSSKYQGAGIVVFAMSMGLAVQAIGSVTSIGIVFSKRSYLNLYGYGVMLFVAAVTIPVLGTRFGLAGVAMGSMAGIAVKTLIGAWLAQRVHPIAWDYFATVLLGVVTLMVGLLHQGTYGRFIFLNVNFIPVIGLAVLFAVAWAALFNSAGRAQVATFMRARLGRAPSHF